MKKLWAVLLSTVLLASCASGTTSGNSSVTSGDTDPANARLLDVRQGVSATEIKIGATIVQAGIFAFVGVPYGNFYKSFVEYINSGTDPEYAQALGGRKLVAQIYDDEGDGAKGKTYVQKLINDDKVFAIVGLLGTWNLVAAQNDLIDSGIPSVYFGTGSSAQMFEPAVDNERYLMGVQPLYKTEGRLMYLRSVYQFGANVKTIGVIHSASDDGLSIKSGIETQFALDTRPNKPRVIYQQVSTSVAAEMTSQIDAIRTADVIIAAGNQAYFKATYAAAQTNAATRGKPIITTYVNIAPAAMPEEAVVPGNSEIYGAAWVVFGETAGSSTDADRRLKDYAEFVKIVDANVGGHIPNAEKELYKANAYAMSSFVAIKMFFEGLKRLQAEGKEITAKNYLLAMEKGRLPVAISGGVNYAGGERIGLDSLSFVKYQRPTTPGALAAAGSFVEVSPMTSIEELVKALS